MTHLYLFLFFAGISALAIYFSIKIFPKLGLLDSPERYGESREKIPYPGGITLVILVLALLVWQKLWILSGLIIILAGISFWDDRKNIAILPRLIVQLLTALIFAIFITKINYIGNPFAFGSFEIGQNSAIFLTIVWIMAIQNAMNWIDGLKGLCVGVSGIGFLALGIFGLVRPEVLWETDLTMATTITFSIAGILLGSLLAFFRGKILLGDTGSQVIGFLLAGFSIIAGTKIITTLLILGLPILDLGFVTLRRIFLDKKSPFLGDGKHLHHLISRKIGEQKAVLLFMAISATFAGISIFLTSWHKLATLLILLIIILGLYLYSWKQGK